MNSIKIIILALFLIGSIESASKKRTKLGEKESKREKSDNKDDDKDEKSIEDENELAINATLNCYECMANTCVNKTDLNKIQCEPNDYCWKSHVKGGYLRGCASRSCIPRLQNITEQYSSFSNWCCTSDLCNLASLRFKVNHILISLLFLLIIIVFI